MKYHQLTTEERSQIYALKSTGKKQNEIAQHLGMSASTICRELQRNSGKKGYRYKQANAKAIQRRHNASCRPLKMTISLVEVVEKKLFEKWARQQNLWVV